MILKGKLITCKREEKNFKNKKGRSVHVDPKLFITLAEVTLSDKQKKELLAAFKDNGDNFTPTWLKNFEGYVNLSTQFELPCRDLDGGEYDSIEEFIKNKDINFPWHKAPVALSLNIKEGAIYPAAIVFTGEGDSFNPFADFDNEDED